VTAATPPGTRRVRVVHRTGFEYDKPVGASYNEARMSPVSTADQTVLDSRVEVSPVTSTFSYRDYWGSSVTSFDVLVPHDELVVTSSCLVEVHPTDGEGPTLDWAGLADEQVSGELVEYLEQSVQTDPPDDVRELAVAAAAELPPAQAAVRICEQLRDRMEYQQGVTEVQTSAAEAWAAGKGVCQDFAHLSLGALRSVGIPARYVSGYLHPRAEATVGETVQGQSHAWVEWYTGRWTGYDPTAVRGVGVDHVLVARGRHYNDVTPLKGIYAGPSSSTLFVSVEVTWLT
jgi:transglutaminase-like putative cysteine protease